jgi:MFS transporter, FHS family, L-fucose permease
VQFVYLAVSCAGVLVAALFAVTRLPEVSEAMLEAADSEDPASADGHGHGPLWRQYNLIFGFVAQFCYVGAQVTVAAYFINYATENANYDDATASNMFSYALITFTVSRFIATALSVVLQADFLLMIYAALAIAFNAVVCAKSGPAAAGVLIALFFFEAPMYPTIFALGTANLGRHTRRGAGILVMGVSGGAVFPPIQGAIADSAGTRISYVVPLVGFVYVLGYVTVHWLRHGRHVLRQRDVDAAPASASSLVEGSEDGMAVRTGGSTEDEKL